MTSVIYTVLLIGSFLFLVWRKTDMESYFPLKIIGYFILGSFAFNFNQISLPLGFLVYLLFFRPTLNVQIKRISAVLGVLSFILVHWTIPYVVDYWESRPVYIKHELNSVYTINFQKEYEIVKQGLKLENNSLRLEDFDVDYTKDGRISDLSWQLLEQNYNSYNIYQIRYNFGNKSYRVISNQLDTWLQYNRLIDANYFFEHLNMLDIKAITDAKGDFSSYGIKSSGERVNYGIIDRSVFVMLNGKTKLLDNNHLPVEGYYISTFAMKKTGEKRDDHGNITQESFEATKSSDYLFDVNINEE